MSPTPVHDAVVGDMFWIITHDESKPTITEPRNARSLRGLTRPPPDSSRYPTASLGPLITDLELGSTDRTPTTIRATVTGGAAAASGTAVRRTPLASVDVIAMAFRNLSAIRIAD